MKLLIFAFAFCLQTLSLHADNKELYKRLDSVIAHRADYDALKEQKIHNIKLGSAYVTSKEDKLRMYERLVNEYTPYIFDSAFVYTQKSIDLAVHTNDTAYFKKFQIIKARLLVFRGFYIEAKEILDDMSVPPSDRQLNYLYNSVQCALYFNLKLSCRGTEYDMRYDKLFHKYMDNTLLYSTQKDAQYYYMKGAQLAYSNGNIKDIDACLSKVMSQLKPGSRLYGMSAFIMSKVYGIHHQPELQERYLLLAAISDVMSATNESMALQEVALSLYEHDVRKAQRYINVSLSDANVFSSKLRRIELYSNMHTILSAYNHELENAGKWHIVLTLSIIVLLVVIVWDAMRIKRNNNLLRQNEKNLTAQTEQLNATNSKQKEANDKLVKSNDALVKSNDELVKSNDELKDSNKALKDSNKALQNSNDELKDSNKALQNSNDELQNSNDALQNSNDALQNSNKALQNSNDELKDSNKALQNSNDKFEQINAKREYIAKSYISLCYLYIEKLESQRKMVIRKIKANQQKELLSILSSSKRTAEENHHFFSQFDSIFLSFYPTFVKELNTLLTPEAQVELKENNELTPSLRVAALIRLGVTESSVIAGILSYSPQTIYNYRSALKNGAIDKDSFEENLLRLCAVY